MDRPELQTYAQRLSWSTAQLAHQRATSRAQAVATDRADMALGELSLAVDANEPVLARFEALDQLLKKGKGKGKIKSVGGASNQQSGGKGGPQGGGAGPGGKPSNRSDIVCWDCGKHPATNTQRAKRAPTTCRRSPRERARAKALAETGP